MATENVRPVPVLIAARAGEEFCQRWLSSLSPSLHLETAPDGEVRVSCQVHAGGPHRAVARHCQGQQEEQRRVQAGGARHADAGPYQGRRDGKRREGVGGVRLRGAAYRRRLVRRAEAREVNDQQEFLVAGTGKGFIATEKASDVGGGDDTAVEAGYEAGAAEVPVVSMEEEVGGETSAAEALNAKRRAEYAKFGIILGAP